MVTVTASWRFGWRQRRCLRTVDGLEIWHASFRRGLSRHKRKKCGCFAGLPVVGCAELSRDAQARIFAEAIWRLFFAFEAPRAAMYAVGALDPLPPDGRDLAAFYLQGVRRRAGARGGLRVSGSSSPPERRRELVRNRSRPTAGSRADVVGQLGGRVAGSEARAAGGERAAEEQAGRVLKRMASAGGYGALRTTRAGGGLVRQLARQEEEEQDAGWNRQMQRRARHSERC